MSSESIGGEQEGGVFKKPTIQFSMAGTSAVKKSNALLADSDSAGGGTVADARGQMTKKTFVRAERDLKTVARPDAKVPLTSKPEAKDPPKPDVPSWCGPAPENYGLEVLKNGTIIESMDLCGKSSLIIGRLDSCDFKLEHPSISRFHAILCYRSVTAPVSSDTTSEHKHPGWYLKDLGSTHGSFANKRKLTPHQFLRVRVGHVIKFGMSTRLFLLQGPENDMEEECELTVTELKERAVKQRLIMEGKLEMPKTEPKPKAKPSEGISWGIGE